MKLNFTLLLFFSLAGLQGLAQADGSVRGRLQDTTAHSPVADATITILNARDSSLVSFARSTASGVFALSRLSNGTYRLLVSHVGYGSVSRNFVITDLVRTVDLGEIVLTDKSSTLEAVTVQQEAPPVSIRHDTIEFNAGSFRTKPDAVVEDLLKKLPGVQVDKDGNIKANGQQVKKVLVDGKEFFGNDPKIASKNLPADAVDKVQVFDKKSDQSEFTGFDDGNSQRTINLTIKKDRKHGVFGRLTAGGGRDAGGATNGGGTGGAGGSGQGGSGAGADFPALADGRYESKFNLNQFSDNRQLSALGLWNNTNKQGFSFQDVMGFNNGGIGMSGGGRMTLDGSSSGVPIQDLGSNNPAITTTKAGGVNYSDNLRGRTDIGGSYFFNRADDRIRQKDLKQYLTPENSYNQDHTGATDRSNQNQRLNFLSDTRLDSFNSMKIVSGFTWQRSNSSSSSIDSSRDRGSNDLLNTSASHSMAYMNGYNWNNSALLRHRFALKGRTLSVNLSFGLNKGTGGGDLYSVNKFYPVSSGDTLDQQYNQSSHGNNYGAVVNYTEPFSKRSLLEMSYNFYQSHSETGKQTFDADATGKYSLPNQQQTNDLRNTFTYHREGLAFRHQRESFNFTLGAALQQAISTNVFGYVNKDSLLRQTFNSLLPNALFQYNINKYRNLRMQYITYTNQPSLSQLQPVPDNSDPLNIKAGNPGLRQEYYHSLRLNYISFDPFQRTSFFAMLNYNGIQHRIVNDDQIDSVGVRTSRPVNLDGLYQTSGFISWDFPIRAIHSMVNLKSDVSYDHNASLVNGVRNNGNTWTLGQGVDVNFSYKELLDISGGTKVEYNDARYSLLPGQNQQYWTETYNLDLNCYLPKGLSFASDINYVHRSGLPAGYNSHPFVWNAGVASQLFKNKRGLLRLQVFDILRQNTGFSRSTSQNYIDDMSYQVLNRYWLVSFSYSINRFAGKAVKGGAARRGPDIKIVR
ncbi:MAG TPA: TonB-dependent receptor [Puia sp.]|nr:TonB-dependent receptor [Puia sp.]